MGGEKGKSRGRGRGRGRVIASHKPLQALCFLRAICWFAATIEIAKSQLDSPLLAKIAGAAARGQGAYVPRSGHGRGPEDIRTESVAAADRARRPKT